MKKVIYLVLGIFGFALTSCETVAPGHKGVEISWGGKTNMEMVYPEGMDGGLHWIWDDMVQYDVRERTIVEKYEFNDKDKMITAVEVSMDYSLIGDKVNILHTKVSDVETKILKTLKAACKEVIPQYSAVELNLSHRGEAEDKISKILSEEFPNFYVNFARIQLTDVDLPAQVSKLAEETAVQIGRNELASKKEAEQKSLALAKVATAKGNFEAAELDAKTKKLLSTPEILKLKELEVEMEYAKKGVSKYGNNNVFGSNAASLIKGL